MNSSSGQPVGSFQPRLTPAVKHILISIVVIFLVQQSFHQFAGISIERLLGFAPVTFFLGPYLWQLLTYPFLHGSLSHILFNGLVLYLLGSELEGRWRTVPFLKYFFVCAMGGAVLQSLIWGICLLFFPDAASYLGNIPVIGASGALYGLFMAFGRIYGDTNVLVFFLFPMKAKNFVLLLFGIELVSAVFYNATGNDGRVAHLVHLGGLITGYIYLRIKGNNLDGRGGGFFGFGKRKQLDRDEVKRRLSLVVNNNEPKKGDKDFPITWN